MKREQLIGFGIIALLVIGAFIGMRMFSKDEPIVVREPELRNISAVFVTSTQQVVIRWEVVHKEISSLNTGVRYDFTSHATSSAESETYPHVAFPVTEGRGYKALIDIVDAADFYYRIQVADKNEFYWSSEAQVIILHVSDE